LPSGDFFTTRPQRAISNSNTAEFEEQAQYIRVNPTHALFLVMEAPPKRHAQEAVPEIHA
jgi:hypothetical protein